jgi:CO/xanthine dehydrogenase FAD-binding subunit
MWKAYEIPSTVEAALQLLEYYDGQAQIIAGGTDLLVELQHSRERRACLVDVTRIQGLDGIATDGRFIALGPNVSFRQVIESPLLQERAEVLVEAARSVGALPIQTVATLAGNIASAQPAADGSVALLALEAEVELATLSGRRWRPIFELFLGPGKSDVDPRREMITGIRFPPLASGSGSAWERIGRRPALVLPILNCAVCVSLSEKEKRFRWARIALGPVAPVPFRAQETEAFVAGRVAGEETICQAAEVAAGEAQPRSNPLRASREYRLTVLKVLVRQGLERAVSRARENGP